MKKSIISLVLALTLGTAMAQKEMPEIWQTKLEHRAEMNELDEASGYIISSSDKEMSIVDSKTGKVKWTNSFKKLTNGKLNKVDERIPMWEAGVVFLFDRKKMAGDDMACVDLNTGEMLWHSDKYEGVTGESIAYIPELKWFSIASKKAMHMIKARNGEELWETQGFKGRMGLYTYNANENTIVALNVNSGADGGGVVGSIFGSGVARMAQAFGAFKSQLTKLNVKNGDVIWQQDLRYSVEREIKTGKLTARMQVLNSDKLLLYLNGLSVYEMGSGKLIWSVVHDESIMEAQRSGIGAGYVGQKVVRSAVYHAVADPIIDGNDVYVLDIPSRTQQFVSKYDINTGKLLWKSKEIKNLKVAPNMYKVGDKIVLQVGGWVEVQALIEQAQQLGGFGGVPGMQMKSYKRVRYFKEMGPFGVMAFNLNNGTDAWRSERFSKGVTNAFVHNNELIVASGKELYNLNPGTGAEKYEVSVKDDDIKQTERIFRSGDNAIIVCTKGVSSHVASTGAKNWAVRIKKGDLYDLGGNTAFYATEKSDQTAIDLATGVYTTYDARKGADTETTEDGSFMFIFEKDKVTKVATRG